MSLRKPKSLVVRLGAADQEVNALRHTTALRNRFQGQALPLFAAALNI